MTFTLLDEKGEVCSEITFTGAEWDRIYSRLMRLTPAGLDQLANSHVEMIPVHELTPERVNHGGKLFVDGIPELLAWCNSQDDPV